METINEVYEEIKQKRNNAKLELNKVDAKVNNCLKDYDFKSGTTALIERSRLIGEVDAYQDVITLIERSGVLEGEKVKDKALDLACENIRNMYCSDYCSCTRDERCKGKCCYEQYYDKEKILNQAKEELEKGSNNE